MSKIPQTPEFSTTRNFPGVVTLLNSARLAVKAIDVVEEGRGTSPQNAPNHRYFTSQTSDEVKGYQIQVNQDHNTENCAAEFWREGFLS
jgi:hypothetical protein